MNEIKLNGNSKDIILGNISKLKELFPEVVTEDKIDFKKLELILGEDIDDSKEKYSFTWPGKSQAIRESQKQSAGTLRPSREDSKHWDTTQNLYIEGDNLEVLKLLQKSYYNKIKAIYIDPPYNTGKDFIYSDNYKDNLENYLELSGQSIESEVGEGIKLTNNPETAGRYHTDWLNMIYPRLKLSRNLLTNDGTIFVSIDDNELYNLKKICDEIFGSENFIANLIWKQGRKSAANSIAVNHEYCLIYAKNKGYLTKNNINSKLWMEKKKGLDLLYSKEKELKIKYGNDFIKINKDYQNFLKSLPKDSPSFKHKHYKFIDENGIYFAADASAPDNPQNRSHKPLIHPITHKKTKVPKMGWRYNEQTLDKLVSENKFHFGKDETVIPCIKRYLKDTEFENGQSVFYKDGRGASKRLDTLMDGKCFDFPKDEFIIKKFIKYVCINKDDLILDFFSGSGTTAHSIFELNVEDISNCKFILVQIPEMINEKSNAYKLGYENICEIGKERIRRAGDKIVKESGNNELDIGFKVFKLDSSNLEKWDPDYNDIQQSLTIDNIKEDRTNEDLVYEIMLKYGIDLTLPIEKHDNIYSIGFGALVICLDDNITKNITNSILEFTKDSSTSRVVFKDSGFKSDADKTNIKEILKTNNIEEFITI